MRSNRKERGTLSRPVVQSDVQRIVEVYRRSGRYDVSVNPVIIELPNSRVDLVFEINEGARTNVRTIEFVGNRAYSGYRLKEVIKTAESGLLAFLQTANIYDPDRIEADRELLRRFYLKHGYIDVRIVGAAVEYRSRRARLRDQIRHRGGRPVPDRHRRRAIERTRARSGIGAIEAADVRRAKYSTPKRWRRPSRT